MRNAAGRPVGVELPAVGARGNILFRTLREPHSGVSRPLFARSPVLLAALFGFGAAVLLVGVVTGDLLALAVGGVLVVVALRQRHHLQPQATAAGGSDDRGAGDPGEPGKSGESGDSGTAEPQPGEGDAEEGVGGEDDAPGADRDGLVVEAAEEATKAAEDGETLHGSGYRLRGVTTGEPVDAGKLRLRHDGAEIIALEVTDQDDELQADEFAPGRPVVLVPHRGPEGRVDGIRVFDEIVDHLAGWLPAESAEQLAGELRRGTLPARSLYQWRDAAGRRRGLTVLVHRAGTIVEE